MRYYSLYLVHSFDKMPRTLFVPIFNTSSKYKNIPKGSLLGTFETINEEVSEVQVTSWTELEGKMRKVHQQLRKKKVTDKPDRSVMTRQENQ